MIKIKYNRLVFTLIVILNIFSSKTLGQTNVLINPEIKHQTIEGWGVSLAWWANLAGGMGDEVIEELAGYAVDDLNLNVFRFNIAGGENPNCTEGDHFRKDGALIPNYRSPQSDNEGWGTYDLTKDVRQIAVMNKIAELRAPKGDIITEMISYSPPWWMTHSECSSGNVVATVENLKPAFIDDFADYLASATKGLDSAYPNWNISYIVPFNEPISGYWKKGGNQEGSAIYAPTQAQVLWRLWQRKNALGIADIKLSGSDNSKVTSALINMTAIKNNNFNEYNGLSKITTHSYGGSWRDKADLADFAKNNGNKSIWQTETGPLSWQRDGRGWFARHYDMAYRLIEDLRNLKATVWCDWQLMSRDDGWGMIHQTNWDENNPYKEPVFNKTRGFYLRKIVTNHIKVGYQIISSDDANTVSAISPDGNEIVVVLVNSSESSENYTIDLSKFSNINEFKTYRTSGETSTSGENAVVRNSNTITQKGVLIDKKISYIAKAYSLTTFVIDVSSSLSNSDFNKDELKVYPNPFETHCNFKFSRSLSNGELIIYDISGKEVKKVKRINSKEITVKRDSLKSGIYFYKLSEDKKVLAEGKLSIK
ncbi:T9SS type A sorting domain-containing protein [Polaribacter sp. Hel_I_88]|uniref:T9SS type A sorting domain-containing protein n=1 Tax=Polaribacter sp. Hel_I_88 TaxID=1250006 RepID=UPI00047BE2E9|nr:T9SS type A sorting domain-containing protein [Polaribacter sp. Hel_I_88]